MMSATYPSPSPSPRLLGQVLEMIRYKDYSLKTEEVYLYQERFFVRWHGRSGVMRPPRDMGGAEVQAYFVDLVVRARTLPS